MVGLAGSHRTLLCPLPPAILIPGLSMSVSTVVVWFSSRVALSRIRCRCTQSMYICSLADPPSRGKRREGLAKQPCPPRRLALQGCIRCLPGAGLVSRPTDHTGVDTARGRAPYGGAGSGQALLRVLRGRNTAARYWSRPDASQQAQRGSTPGAGPAGAAAGRGAADGVQGGDGLSGAGGRAVCRLASNGGNAGVDGHDMRAAAAGGKRAGVARRTVARTPGRSPKTGSRLPGRQGQIYSVSCGSIASWRVNCRCGQYPRVVDPCCRATTHRRQNAAAPAG